MPPSHLTSFIRSESQNDQQNKCGCIHAASHVRNNGSKWHAFLHVQDPYKCWQTHATLSNKISHSVWHIRHVAFCAQRLIHKQPLAKFRARDSSNNINANIVWQILWGFCAMLGYALRRPQHTSQQFGPWGSPNRDITDPQKLHLPPEVLCQLGTPSGEFLHPHILVHRFLSLCMTWSTTNFARD